MAKKVIVGENNILSINPSLATEWYYEKNEELTPDKICLNSNRKVWWKCHKGHEWQATPNNRNNGNGCPYCANQKVLLGYNDLSTLYPQLVTEWNYEKNDGMTPDQMVAGSTKKVWWKCSKGHEWQATIVQRKKGKDCPYCKNRRVLKGFNDLATQNPALAAEWNYEKYGSLTPDQLPAQLKRYGGSAPKVMNGRQQ